MENHTIAVLLVIFYNIIFLYIYYHYLEVRPISLLEVPKKHKSLF